MQVKEAESKRRKARNQKRSWECSPARKSIKQANFSAFRPHPVRNFIPCEAPGNGQCLKISGMQRSDWQQSQVTRPHRPTVPVAPARGPPWPRPPQKNRREQKRNPKPQASCHSHACTRAGGARTTGAATSC